MSQNEGPFKNITDSLFQTKEAPFSIQQQSFVSSTSSSSSPNWTLWIIIILVLALVGINIFVYLAKGTQTFADIFGPLTRKLFGGAAEVTGQTVDVAAEGAKSAVKTTADVTVAGLSAVQEVVPSPSKTKSASATPERQPKDASLQKSLDTSAKKQGQDYQGEMASSTVHSKHGAGWCYVGEDRGYRSCARVGVDDTCMSGDIFPTQEICINPNLRM